MTEPTLRTEVRPSDPALIRAMTQATGVFSAAETDVAVELAETALEKGPAYGYHFFFLDDAQGNTLGYVCYGPTACTVGTWDLYWIAVWPKGSPVGGHGRGYGTTLLRATEDAVRAAQGRLLVIETSSRADYEPTRRFYLHGGYHIAAQLENFYAPGDHRVIFIRELGPSTT